MTDWLDARSPVAGAAGGPAGGARDWLEGLNDAQRRAVTHEEGPLLILAGPGSGKTRVVTSRIVWLVTERGVRPEEILAITFTNKAAREMRERVERLLDPRGAWIGTFHATCARILRREIEILGERTRDFTILDTADRNQLLKRLIREAGFDTTRFRPAAVGSWISRRKNAPREDRDAAEGGIEDELLVKVHAAYERALRETNALDFDDLLLEVLRLFEAHPGVRDAYAHRFRHVMVDEYQDTNHVQYLLARHLASVHRNLAVCGDPDQSIYSWRGADIRNILDFERDYPDPKIVKLERNYRSTGTILKAAQAVIRHNVARKDKDLFTEAGDGAPIEIIECGDENDEAACIAERVRELCAEGLSPAEMAVFYRVNFMQRALETQLRLAGVAYQVVGGLEFYQRREIKDLIAWLRLLVNPRDELAFTRAAGAPKRGIGEKSLQALIAWSADRRVPLARAARSEEALGRIRGRARAGLAAMGELLAELEPLADGQAADALERVIEATGYEEWLAQEQDERTADRLANVDELQTHAREFDRLHPQAGLRGFLQDVALVSDVDDLDEQAERVKLMTLHSAKGLEFRVVFIAGLEEDLLPHFRALEDDPEGGLEEERRLFYVGITRARERLLLTWASRRLHFGQTSAAGPSRFLDEIPPELVTGWAGEEPETDPLGVFEAPPAQYATLAVGDHVEHATFGRGVVEHLRGTGINARARVRFVAHGTKELLLEYAPLEVVR